jgi:hypothetical protein
LAAFVGPGRKSAESGDIANLSQRLHHMFRYIRSGTNRSAERAPKKLKLERRRSGRFQVRAGAASGACRGLLNDVSLL